MRDVRLFLASVLARSVRSVLMRTHVILMILSGLSWASSAQATPVSFYVNGIVETVGADGWFPAARVEVSVYCQGCNSLTTFTSTDGTFYSSNYGSGEVFFGSATVDGVVLRSLARGDGNSVWLTINPITEAAVQLALLRGYSFEQQLLILDAVIRAVPRSSLAGLSISDAIARALDLAIEDSHVQAVLPTWTPTQTPTVTQTSTPTPTRTLRPTGTPRPCTGDCLGDGVVRVDELVAGVEIILGRLPASACSSGYGGSEPQVADVITAVRNAIYGCEPSGALPDIVPISVELGSGPACRPYYDSSLNYCLRVCIANVGDAVAPRFRVFLDGERTSHTWNVGGLVAGDGECNVACNAGFAGSVRVDAEDSVPEAVEDNNVAPFRIVTPTPPRTCPTATPT